MSQIANDLEWMKYKGRAHFDLHAKIDDFVPDSKQYCSVPIEKLAQNKYKKAYYLILSIYFTINSFKFSEELFSNITLKK